MFCKMEVNIECNCIYSIVDKKVMRKYIFPKGFREVEFQEGDCVNSFSKPILSTSDVQAERPKSVLASSFVFGTMFSKSGSMILSFSELTICVFKN